MRPSRPLAPLLGLLCTALLASPLLACGSRKERCERIVEKVLANNLPAEVAGVRAILEGPSPAPLPDGAAARGELVTRCIATRASEICLDCLDTAADPLGCTTCKPR